MPAPVFDRPGGARPFAAPGTDLERTIAGTWREVLGVDRVGVDDNFFDLGGHSLLMAQLRVVLEARLGREVSMVELFQYPSVGALAGHLSRPGPDGDGLSAAVERAGSRRHGQADRRQAAARRVDSWKR
ncbi:acyl carrier protein [Dactylosporangium sp. CA-233914]|uniref:acyl carrier protein n=1 Tax=Dactylosporangium sp. CA-233914 TaxID=3239934 RepID=UPI003D9342C3